MSTEMAGQDAPVVVNEAPEVAQIPATTTEAQTDGAEGGNESPDPKTVTLTEEELHDRIARATAKAAAKAERKAFREATQRLQSQAVAQEPQREDFNDEAKYSKAQLDFYVKQEAQRLLQEREQAAVYEQMQEKLHERIESAMERYSDFKEVVINDNVAINSDMAEFIAESDVGADVAYYLGKNRAKAAQIYAMSPAKAMREMHRLESEVSKAPPSKTVSNAPAPIKPIAARSSGTPSYDTTDPRSIKTMSTSEWIAAENARMMKKLESRYRT